MDFGGVPDVVSVPGFSVIFLPVQEVLSENKMPSSKADVKKLLRIGPGLWVNDSFLMQKGSQPFQ